MRTQLRTKLLLSAPGLALAAGSVAVALESPNSDRLINAILAGIGVVLVWSVAVAVRLRYPTRPLGMLLFILAVSYAIQTLSASPNPYLFTLARAGRPAVEVMLIWVMLAFPSGRLQGWPERSIVIGSALAVTLLWLPGVMLSPVIPLAGSYVMCHPDCPRNILFLADWPGAAAFLHVAFRVMGIAILGLTAALLYVRLREATPLMRRSLTPVLVASIARALVMACFLAGSTIVLGFSITFWAIPLAIALGLLRGRLYVAKALQQLVTGLRERPSLPELQRVLATALDDTSLYVAYWLKEGARWVDGDGQPVLVPYPAPENGHIAKILMDTQGTPVAALVHDVALLEEPMLIEAVASSMLGVLNIFRMDAELGASRAHTASAVEEERHRIERDLHDGAQQRLIAMRMKLSVASRLLDHDPNRVAAMLCELGSDVDASLAELRSLAHGITAPVLVESGLSEALRDVAQNAAIPVRCVVEDVGRCHPGVERAIYFCCLEALQNAAKHAGPQAVVELTLQRVGNEIRFSICDTGKGAGTNAQTPQGQGLRNMRERISAIGGQFFVEASPVAGFQVSGTVPV